MLRLEKFRFYYIYFKATCLGKVQDIKKKIEKEKIPFDILIFCDTICFCQNKIIEKPVFIRKNES